MTSAEFDAEAWIERVARLLPPLARAQEPFLREYQERYAASEKRIRDDVRELY